MLVVNGTIPLWEYHRDRLLSGVKILGIKIGMEAVDRHKAMVMAAIGSVPDNPLIFKLIITPAGTPAMAYYQYETSTVIP